ncbi:MAG: Unknown protein [uncultured Thiotrichaceae bacterium]|uniref:Uncharacterized protein n=1 Tax=uncultured Thiotrichaceae bacterium TaxID=298394 RepID=A0A6S6T701_9GAMM|nr:MAG: Unknown protein [uncultured Thiotrichaceae bacterium]
MSETHKLSETKNTSLKIQHETQQCFILHKYFRPVEKQRLNIGSSGRFVVTDSTLILINKV